MRDPKVASTTHSELQHWQLDPDDAMSVELSFGPRVQVPEKFSRKISFCFYIIIQSSEVTQQLYSQDPCCSFQECGKVFGKNIKTDLSILKMVARPRVSTLTIKILERQSSSKLNSFKSRNTSSLSKVLLKHTPRKPKN